MKKGWNDTNVPSPINEIYIENCNIFLNDFHNKKTIYPHAGHSYKKSNDFKTIENKSNDNKSIKKIFLRKNTVNVPKSASIHKNFPILRLSTPKKVKNDNINNSSQKKKKL